MAFPRSTLFGLLWVALTVAACAEPRSGRWAFRFATPAVADRAAAVQGRILRGGCDGTAIFETTFVPGEKGDTPQQLPPGVYGLSGTAIDAMCLGYANGCVEVDLPLTDGAEVIVALEDAAASFALCDPGVCSDGFCPPVDAGAEEDGGEAVPDSGCGADSEPTCEDGRIVSCVSGEGMVETCALGCGGDPPVCLGLEPANVRGRIRFDQGIRALRLDGSACSLDTTSGEIACGGTEIRGDGVGLVDDILFEVLPPVDGSGPSLGAFVFRSLAINDGTTVTALGANALVLMAENVTIDGILSVDGVLETEAEEHLHSGGSGGELTGDGGGPGAGEGNETGAGAGGSFGSAGGTGPGRAASVNPGPTYGNASLEPLLAGSGGGGGSGGFGAPGGGALQVSASGILAIGPRGLVSACGAGGEGGQASTSAIHGAGGGGSGGGVILEGLIVTINGAVAANGGGGGQGGSAVAAGQAGADGSASEVPAPGGGGVAAAGGRGEAGSDASGVAGDGQGTVGAGAGGGGAGRIRINTPTGSEAFENLTPTVASGLASVGRAGAVGSGS